MHPDPTNPHSLPSPAQSSAHPVAAARRELSAIPTRTLSQLAAGQSATILETKLSDEELAPLRAMGLCPGADVTLRRAGEPCIVSVCTTGQAARACACRIGITASIARRIVVTDAFRADPLSRSALPGPNA